MNTGEVTIPAKDHRALLRFIREQQLSDWNELYAAIGRAVNGHWSMECERLVDRIRAAVLLVGISDWYQCPWPLVRQGLFQMIEHSVLGDKQEIIPFDAYEATSRMMERHTDPAMLERCMLALADLQRYLEPHEG